MSGVSSLLCGWEFETHNCFIHFGRFLAADYDPLYIFSVIFLLRMTLRIMFPPETSFFSVLSACALIWSLRHRVWIRFCFSLEVMLENNIVSTWAAQAGSLGGELGSSVPSLLFSAHSR